MHCLAWLYVALFLRRTSSFATVQPNSTIHGLRNITFKDVSQAALETLDAGASSKRIHQRPTSTALHPPTISPTTSANPSQAEFASARALVANAHASQAAYNKWRLANPNFNTYRSKTSAGNSMSKFGEMKRLRQVCLPKLLRLYSSLVMLMLLLRLRMVL